MSQGVIQRGFAAGELAPILHARADAVRYTQGLKTCKNFLVRREGGISNRPGTIYTVSTKATTAGTKLYRYVDANGRGYLIEAGAGYFRFIRDGVQVTVSGVAAYVGATAYVPGDLVSQAGVNYYCILATTGNAPPDVTRWYPLTGSIYEVPTPYTLDAMPQAAQSGNVLTFTHASYAPRDLTFTSATRWVLAAVVTTPSIAAPTNLVMTPGPLGPGPLIYSYVVTAAKADSYEESVPSAAVTDAVGGLVGPSPILPHSITWDLVAGAVEYYIYCDPYQNGIYGLVGSASAPPFHDVGFVPDFNVTPPIAVTRFNATDDYPTCAAHYQQRRFFGNTNTNPDEVTGSRVGFPNNFGIASPLQDDDAVKFKLAGNNQHAVRHLRALKAGLVVMTDGGEWTLTGGGGPLSPITPSSITAVQETYVGVASVPPVVVGNAIIYVQARGSLVHEVQFDQGVEGIAGKDLTIFASHLFERMRITAMDLQQAPHSIVWAVRDDGVLLGLTYVPEQDVWGWHRHETEGSFEDVCVVPEDGVDTIYVLVSRTVASATVRYIERFARRDLRVDAVEDDAIFLDCAKTYTGASTSAITGLSHLNGLQVYALVNGSVQGPFTVSGGAITLTTAGTIAHVGIAYTPRAELLDFDVQGSDVRGKRKRVAAIRLLLERSSLGFSAGIDDDNLRSYSPEAWESSDDEVTGAFELLVTSEFNDYGRLIIEQPDPLPITILGVIPQMDIGG